MKSTAFEKSIAQPVAQLGNGADLGRHRLDVVGQAIELDMTFVLIKHGVAGPGIEIAGLPDRTWIDDQEIITLEFVDTVDILGWIEVRLIGEHTRNMGMTDQAPFLHSVKDLLHLHR